MKIKQFNYRGYLITVDKNNYSIIKDSFVVTNVRVAQPEIEAKIIIDTLVENKVCHSTTKDSE